jgi:hypothetical protein
MSSALEALQGWVVDGSSKRLDNRKHDSGPH